jgi:hypothetical protein
MEDNKPKSIRNIRKLKKKSNRISESFKRTIFIRGNKTSNNVINFLKDIVPNILIFRDPLENKNQSCMVENIKFIHSKAEIKLKSFVQKLRPPYFYSDHIIKSALTILSSEEHTKTKF